MSWLTFSILTQDPAGAPLKGVAVRCTCNDPDIGEVVRTDQFTGNDGTTEFRIKAENTRYYHFTLTASTPGYFTANMTAAISPQWVPSRTLIMTLSSTGFPPPLPTPPAPPTAGITITLSADDMRELLGSLSTGRNTEEQAARRIVLEILKGMG